MPPEEREESASDRSGVRACYWVLCGQFRESNDDGDDIRSGIVAVGLATGTLCLTAATSALLASVGNWEVTLFLFLPGIEALLFAWFTGLRRLDRILVRD